LKNWKREDIIELSIYYDFNSKEILNNIKVYNSLNTFKKSTEFEKILSSKENDIFKNNDDNFKSELEFYEHEKIQIITLLDESYPSLLKEINDPPAMFFVKGQIYPERTSISIVGTRRCTHYGKIATERFTEYFVNKGIVITSGLAYGIDTTAHLAAIKYGGITYSVIASAIECLTPSNSEKNAEKILDSGGAIISTYRKGIKAKPQYFLQRNRIISGLSKAVLIVESKEHGGALWTAKFSYDQNREVFAVPGLIYSETSRGTNALIKNNIAAMAISPESVLLDLNLIEENEISKKVKEEIKFQNEGEKILFELIDTNPIHIDNLSNKSGLEMSEILVHLLNLEFSNHIKQLPGKYYIRYN